MGDNLQTATMGVSQKGQKGQKLQNYFKDFLPMNYRDFRRSVDKLSAKQAVVAELLRLCAEEMDIKAIKIAFERILGKPEKVIIIKKIAIRTVYPEAKAKLEEKPTPIRIDHDETDITQLKDDIVIEADESPGYLLHKFLDEVGEKGRTYAYDVVDQKNRYTVAEVIVANLYAIAMGGGNLSAINLLFDYLDGAVADVIRIETDDVMMIEDYSEVAPYDAIQGEDGVWYVEREAIK